MGCGIGSGRKAWYMKWSMAMVYGVLAGGYEKCKGTETNRVAIHGLLHHHAERGNCLLL